MAEEQETKYGRPSVLTGTLHDLALALGGIAELAKALGVSTRTVNRWNTAQDAPSMEHRARIIGLALQHGVAVQPKFQLTRHEREGLAAAARALGAHKK